MKLKLTLFCTSLLVFAACGPPPETADDRQSRQQSQMTQEASSEVGMPGITHFTEKKLLRKLYELRDQEVETYTYLPTLDGRLIHVCDSIGYGLPYGVQFTNPEHMTRWQLPYTNANQPYYGTEKMQQPEPNGLFMPTTAEGTWVMCGNKSTIAPVYVEPRVVVSPFRLHASGEWMESGAVDSSNVNLRTKK